MTPELLFIIALAVFTWVINQWFNYKGIAIFYETEDGECYKVVTGYASYAELTNKALLSLRDEGVGLTITKIQKI